MLSAVSVVSALALIAKFSFHFSVFSFQFACSAGIIFNAVEKSLYFGEK